MADQTPNIKKFLDYAGLETLWGIITNRFADKDKTIDKLEISTAADGSVQTLVATLADGTTKKTVDLPNASDTQAGLMSAEHFDIVDNFKANIEEWAPFHGFKLQDADGTSNEVTLTGHKATIALKYDSKKDADGNVENAYIALVDPNYPTGEWSTKTEAEYTTAGGGEKWCVVETTGGATQYYLWEGEGVGPRTPQGEPIFAQAISKIDVTELLKTGMLAGADVVVLAAGNEQNLDAGTYLKLQFYVTDNDGNQTIDTEYINVTDLVDTYEAGEGIEIGDYKFTGDDDKSRTGTISLKVATDTTLGGVKIGYDAAEGVTKTYAVQLDANKKAYVAVPWSETKVVASTPADDIDADDNPYLVVDCTPSSTTADDGSVTTTYAVSVAAGTGIKNAEAAARSSVQTLEGHTNYITVSKNEEVDYHNSVTVTLTDSAVASLALADSAVQVVKVGDVRTGGAEGSKDLVVTPAGTDEKGKKEYTITLGDRTTASLNLADSAMQNVTIMGTKLDQADSVYTAAEAKKVMALGSASEVNVYDNADLATATSTVTYVSEEDVLTDNTKTVKNVPTVSAVKGYVDNTASSLTTSYQGYVNTAIDGLDSTASAGTVAAESTAQNEEAQMVFTKLVVSNGKLITSVDDADYDAALGVSEKAQLKLKDITDFRPFTTAEITAICI